MTDAPASARTTLGDAGVVRAGVIGVGYLGAFHAEKYAQLTDVELVGVFDSDSRRAREVAASTGTRAFDDQGALLAAVDAVSVAVPTASHAEVGAAVARAGVHMLVEKPLAATSEQGRRLVAAAEEAGVLLQVGHLERFNPVYEEMRSVVDHPRFIECHRLAPFAGRGVDTNVVYDVMIHDLDLVGFLTGGNLVRVEAVGVAVLSDHVDIANARLRFAGGCVANVTASRVSLKRERKLRVFQEDAYVSMDFDERRVVIARHKFGADGVRIPFDPADPASAMSAIDLEERCFEDADPLLDEIRAFVASVRSGASPRVGGPAGLAAMEMADRIVAALEEPGPASVGTPAGMPDATEDN